LTSVRGSADLQLGAQETVKSERARIWRGGSALTRLSAVLYGRSLGTFAVRFGLFPVLAPVSDSGLLRGLQRPVVGERVVSARSFTALSRFIVVSCSTDVPRRPMDELKRVHALNLTGSHEGAEWSSAVMPLEDERVDVWHASADNGWIVVERMHLFSFAISSDEVQFESLRFGKVRDVNGWLDPTAFYARLGSQT
jgi:hypothetical protein